MLEGMSLKKVDFSYSFCSVYRFAKEIVGFYSLQLRPLQLFIKRRDDDCIIFVRNKAHLACIRFNICTFASILS